MLMQTNICHWLYKVIQILFISYIIEVVERVNPTYYVQGSENNVV